MGTSARLVDTFVLLLCAGSALAQTPLAAGKRIPLPGVEGRIDHLSADTAGHVLFVSALGNHSLEALDVKAGRVVKTIRDLAEPQGVLYIATPPRIFVALAGDGSTRIFDPADSKLLATVRLGTDADNIRYDSRRKHVIVGYGGGALAILDTDGKKAAEIRLDGHPESFQLEKNGSRAFVNVPDAREIEIVDLDKQTVTGKWRVTAASSNFPMALDEAHHRLLIGCRSPARLLALDTDSGKVVDSVEIAGDTDDLFYDPARSRAYVIEGAGSVDVIQHTDPDRYQRIGRVPTASGARTGLFVAEWNQLFVAVPHRGAQAAEVRVFRATDEHR